MKAVNPKATRDYVPECDRNLPMEQQTVFEQVNLSAEEQALLNDVAGASGTAINTAWHLGCAGVRNLTDENGDPVELKRDNKARAILGKRPWANLAVIPMKERDEFAAEVMKGVGVEDSEVKNS